MKTLRVALLGMVTCAVFTAATAGTVYKWVDKDGKVRYSDRPPPDAPAQEVNRSAVPMPLQERLRKLDTDFAIKRIGGNLDTAWVCLEVQRHARQEPAFVGAFSSSGLGDIHKAADVHGDYEMEYDDGGRVTGSGRRKVKDRCPERRHDREAETVFQIYEIKFDPKAVSAYRSAAN